MTTRTQQVTCPLCYDQILIQTVTRGPIITKSYLNLNKTAHQCLDPNTGELKEDILLPAHWLKCPQCGNKRKTIKNPAEHPNAELRISCQECAILWYLSQEEII